MTSETPPSGHIERDEHVLPLRVYYEDTDAGGVVYYANYFKYAERARTEMMRTLGVESTALQRDEGFALAVRHCEADFKGPARLDDSLTVTTRVLGIGGASVDVEQIVARDGQELVAIKILLACMSLEGGAARMPNHLRKILEQICLTNKRG